MNADARADQNQAVKTTLILSRSQVEGLVTMGEVVAEVETIFADLSKGTALQPGALSMSLPSGSGAFVVMPALADRQNLALLKLLADVPDNVEKGLPMQRSVITLVAKDTGAPVAIFHGQIPTRIRTAAASAVASRHLSRPDSRILGLIGAGALALEHIRSHLVVRPIGRVLVWSRKDATVSNLIALAAQEFPDLVVEAAASKQEVFARSDIVCTLTPSRDPVVEGAWFKPGQHINAVGAPPRGDHREIDSAGMARARVVLDCLPVAMHDSGDLLLAIADGALDGDQTFAELGDIIAGKTQGRTSAEEITLFNSVGLALQDIAICALMVARARANGIGTEVDLAG